MAVGDAYVFSGFFTPVLTQLFVSKPPITFLTCFYRSERRKYGGKKSRLNLGSNSQPPGHESDTLTAEPPVTRLNYYETHCHSLAVHPCTSQGQHLARRPPKKILFQKKKSKICLKTSRSRLMGLNPFPKNKF